MTVALALAYVATSYLDEWAGEQETMGKANLHAAQQWVNASAVCWQVAQVPGNNGGRCHRGLKEANEGVTVHGLDHLVLH